MDKRNDREAPIAIGRTPNRPNLRSGYSIQMS
jgi:hypothetical protein